MNILGASSSGVKLDIKLHRLEQIMIQIMIQALRPIQVIPVSIWIGNWVHVWEGTRNPHFEKGGCVSWFTMHVIIKLLCRTMAILQ